MSEWAQFHWTTRENPKLPPEEVEAIYREYAKRPYARDQELDAKLLEGIEGVFFSDFRKDVHVRQVPLPTQGVWFGAGMDWGYSSPGWVGLEAFWQGPYKARQHLFWEWEFQNLGPYQVGYQMGKRMMAYPKPAFIAGDESMWDTGDGRGNRVTPIAEEVQRGLDDACGRDAEGNSRAPTLMKAPKGPGSRLVRATTLQAALAYKAAPDGTIPPWGQPIQTVDPRCVHFIRCMEVLPTDPKNPELPATDGVYDHPYDGKTYLDVIRRPDMEVPKRGPEMDRSYAAEKLNIRVRDEDGYDQRRRREPRERRLSRREG